MAKIETKPLVFSREDIMQIIQRNHEIFERVTKLPWEEDSANQTSFHLMFKEKNSDTQFYYTECLVSEQQDLKYFRTPIKLHVHVADL